MDLTQNLLSIGYMIEHGNSIDFEDVICTIFYNIENKKELMTMVNM
jgi:hypothetical protein